MAVLGAPMPVDAAVISTPSSQPVAIVYSRTRQTHRTSFQLDAIRSTRAGSPQRNANFAMSPGRHPVMAWAWLTCGSCGGGRSLPNRVLGRKRDHQGSLPQGRRERGV